MQVEEFNRHNIKAFGDALQDALDKISDDFGVSFKVSAPRVGGRRTANIAVTASIGDEVSLENTPSGRLFAAYAPHYDIGHALGKGFTFRGVLYKVTGWSASSRTYKVECERLRDGAIVRFAPDHIKSLVG